MDLHVQIHGSHHLTCNSVALSTFTFLLWKQKTEINHLSLNSTDRWLLQQSDQARGSGHLQGWLASHREGFSLVRLGECGRQNHLWMALITATNGRVCSILDVGLNSRLCASHADLIMSLEPAGVGWVKCLLANVPPTTLSPLTTPQMLSPVSRVLKFPVVWGWG